MNALSSASPIADAKDAIVSQARIRIAVGIPVIIAGLLALVHNGVPANIVGAVAFVHTSYIIAMLFLASHPRPFSPEQLALASSILDPLLLTAWLPIAGEIGSLVVGFYLFTILGFGFRTGPRLMLVCQIASIAGFSSVVLMPTYWQEHRMVWFSFLVTLVLVPLYATVLIKKLHEARNHAERESMAKSELLAKVSHELRTPLTGIVAAAQLLTAETEDARVIDRAETVMGLSRDLLREINDLLDQAKYEARALTLDSTLFDLSDQMEQLRLMLEPLALRKNLMLKVEMDARIEDRIQGDSHYLTKVLINLAGNAIKFTDEGKVEVAVTLLESAPERYRIGFCVRDTGIGIPKELHEKIFEPFFQAQGGSVRKHGGTGLGMTIAKEIINLMGGQIRVESAPGAGAQFRFELEFRRVKTRSVPAQPAAPSIVYGVRVLVVDDNITILTLIKEMLQRDRHQVTTAQSGAEALEILSAEAFDVIFLDYNLGDMDGARLFQLYRAGRIQAAPTFFLTADATPATSAKLKATGAAGVLYKPITVDGLRQAIAQVCHAAAYTLAPPNAAHPPLATVPTRYVDENVLASLRTMSDRPDFLADVIACAIADIERNSQLLAQALGGADAESVREKAHALKGVCASVGATRLLSIAARLMQVDADDLGQSAARLKPEVVEATRQTIAALRGALPDKAVNG